MVRKKEAERLVNALAPPHSRILCAVLGESDVPSLLERVRPDAGVAVHDVREIAKRALPYYSATFDAGYLELMRLEKWRRVVAEVTRVVRGPLVVASRDLSPKRVARAARKQIVMRADDSLFVIDEWGV